MKVQVKRTYYQSGSKHGFFSKGDLKECKVVAMPPCCDAMKTAIEDYYIGFGKFTDGFLNRDENINLSLCSPYPEGAYWEFMPIQKCPFCGEDIEIVAQEKGSDVSTGR